MEIFNQDPFKDFSSNETPVLRNSINLVSLDSGKISYQSPMLFENKNCLPIRADVCVWKKVCNGSEEVLRTLLLWHSQFQCDKSERGGEDSGIVEAHRKKSTLQLSSPVFEHRTVNKFWGEMAPASTLIDTSISLRNIKRVSGNVSRRKR